jgi:hypothetical protein
MEFSFFYFLNVYFSEVFSASVPVKCFVQVFY